MTSEPNAHVDVGSFTSSLMSVDACSEDTIPLLELAAQGPAVAAQLAKDGSTADLDAAEKALTALIDKLCDKECDKHSAGVWLCLSSILALSPCLAPNAKPNKKKVALTLIQRFLSTNPTSAPQAVVALLPACVGLANDARKEVKTLALTVLKELCLLCGNRDIIGTGADNSPEFVSAVVRAVESLKQVDASVEALAACIFVQCVEAPHIAVLTPVLWRGLNSTSEKTQRRCCVIATNMCRVVDSPASARPLFPEILPMLHKKHAAMSDPDCRETCLKALNTVNLLHDKFKEMEMLDADAVEQKFLTESTTLPTSVRSLLAEASVKLAQSGCADDTVWSALLGPACSPDKAATVKLALLEAGKEKEVAFVDDSPDPDLYKGSFTLAFGTITLLRDAKLHLKKNKFYGLLGPNNCGKSTLMKAIAMEKLEGFPKSDELKTIYVCHAMDEYEVAQEDGSFGPTEAWPLGRMNVDLNGVDLVLDTVNRVHKKDPPISREGVETALGEMGFGDTVKKVNPGARADMHRPITDYSGGWKVKMQLACAKLIDADIIMFDEPTAHLDIDNQKWVRDWLRNFPGSIIAASSHAPFLDEMCTHIVDFTGLKLTQFKSDKVGSVLSEYVKEKPEKEAYFKVSNRNLKFTFPLPGNLAGVTSLTKAILKMSDVSFGYTTVKNTVTDITLQVSLASRIAVIGGNGAGKSTAIKLLTGELVPNKGTIWRHPNCRIAYVPQHAGKRLEQHAMKTPVQYILWRFAGCGDKESWENKKSNENEESVEALRAVPWMIDTKTGSVRQVMPGEKSTSTVVPDCLLNRRKNKAKKFEYEVKWMHRPVDASCWVERDILLKMGYSSLTDREDEKQALAAGLASRPLTRPNVEQALKDFGMDAETSGYSPIRSLSDGNKMKLALAAATWLCPHILILDEPTNDLDRDGLGALALGLETYQGGVVIISHDVEFTETLCKQQWVMTQGYLTEKGTPVNELIGDDEKLNDAPKEDLLDQFGNVVAATKAMTEKERKKALKLAEKRLKDDKKSNLLSEADRWALEDEIERLKNLKTDDA